MVLEALLASLLTSVEHREAEERVSCALVAQGRNWTHRGPQSLHADCPADGPGAGALEAAADAALAAVDMRFTARRGRPYQIADRIWFERDGDGWAVVPGQIIVEQRFEVPVISNYPANWMICSAELEPAPDGRVPSPRVVCLSDAAERRVTARMEEALLAVLPNTRLLPAPVAYCLDKQYAGYVEIHHPFTGEVWTEGGDPPDPALLPDLCSAP